MSGRTTTPARNGESERADRRVRVLHVYKFLHDGGTERYIHTLASRMDPTRYVFSICCLMERGPKADMFERDGIDVHVLDFRPGLATGAFLNNMFEIARLIRLMRRLRVDVVHTHDNQPAAYARIAAWLARVPVVYVTYHNDYVWLRPIHHRVNRILASLTTRIIAVSSTVKVTSMKRERIPDRKYRVIYNGVFEPARFPPRGPRRLPVEWNLPSDARLIANVASLSRRKGQDLLVDAFGRIAAEFPGVHLVIVGSPRADEPDVEEQLMLIAERHQVRDRVLFAGSRDDVLELMALFDLYVMPSLIEGFGLSLVEAMCAGVPSIASDIDTFTELSEHGRYALLFRSGDAGALTEKLRYALRNREEMMVLGEAAQHYARAKFGVERMIAQYEQLYAQDLSRAGFGSAD